MARLGVFARALSIAAAAAAAVGRTVGAGSASYLRGLSSAIGVVASASRGAILGREGVSTIPHSVAGTRAAALTRRPTSSGSHSATPVRQGALGRTLSAATAHVVGLTRRTSSQRLASVTGAHGVTLGRLVVFGRSQANTIVASASLARRQLVQRAAASHRAHSASVVGRTPVRLALGELRRFYGVVRHAITASLRFGQVFSIRHQSVQERQVIRYSPKDPDSTRNVSIDWSLDLDADETILAVDVPAGQITGGIAVAASSITGQVTTIQVIGGTLGAEATARVQIATSKGQTLWQTMAFRIERL